MSVPREEGARTPVGLVPIGVIRSPFNAPEGTPVQPAYADGAPGQVILDPEYEAALDDLDGFDRVWLLYWMTGVKAFTPHVVPYRDTRERGLFATRSPARPNPIGLSAVTLVRREGRVLHVSGLDVLDGTLLLDLKPYVPEYDAHPDARTGWFGTVRGARQTADGRFHEERPRD